MTDEIKAALPDGEKPEVHQQGKWILLTYASPAHAQMRDAADEKALVELGYRLTSHTAKGTSLWFEPVGDAA